MRSNVETRMCKACNAPLAMRESCARCADKARARLHAERVGHREGWRSYRGDGSSLDEPLPPLTERQRRMFGDGHAMEPPQLAKHEPPPVGAEVSYEVAFKDMKRRPEARYSIPIYTNRYHWNGALVWNDEFNGRDVVSRHADWEMAEHGWTRLPDATTLPAIGAEVSWDVAKRDMQARKEARYRPTCSPGHEYAWASQLVLRELGGLWQSADWSEDVEGQLRWARLT